MLREILSELDNNMSYDELDQMIDEIDADGSGTVDFDGKPTRTSEPHAFVAMFRFGHVRATAKTVLGAVATRWQ